MTLDGIELPGGLIWEDEFDWTPVVQDVATAITGTILIQEAAVLTGRTITLAGSEDGCWAPRSTLEQLFALAQTSGRRMTLILDDAREFSVVWRRGGSSPIQAKQLFPISKPGIGDFYVLLALRFMETLEGMVV